MTSNPGQSERRQPYGPNECEFGLHVAVVVGGGMASWQRPWGRGDWRKRKDLKDQTRTERRELIRNSYEKICNILLIYLIHEDWRTVI